MTKAVFPGSFDPVTNGHLDIIKRASRLFDELVVVVGNNSKKSGWINPTERVALIEQSTTDLKNVSVQLTDGLIIDLMTAIGANVIVRGVRNTGDFDAEKSLATFNHQLNPSIDTFLMPTSPRFESLSSSRVRELCHFGKPVDDYVSKPVADFIKEKWELNEK
ncbi:pantetheine-phosphate adenylyltransferase [Lactobacillus sp. Sy-1]|uniref:pantetheine-phosphate adenylyltransferase n=1 Tax=Lactobacillus sp. Sy-1 TaxID=2109645 RepID=UPI001C55D453|nr:pantetheine-phosphate adenylyltransferase [Lactobacillus sp. Sy-1]MBW1605446.1 pantetheine-phosphate adenylyltransferase [Lactobacillus sp. Sy-1]